MPPQWLKRLPGFRVYDALEQSDARLRALKQTLKRAQGEIEAAKALLLGS